MKTNDTYEITCECRLVATADSLADAEYAARLFEKKIGIWCGIWKNGMPIRTPVLYTVKIDPCI